MIRLVTSNLSVWNLPFGENRIDTLRRGSIVILESEERVERGEYMWVRVLLPDGARAFIVTDEWGKTGWAFLKFV